MEKKEVKAEWFDVRNLSLLLLRGIIKRGFVIFLVYFGEIYNIIKMSDHFLEEEIFFESDPEPNFDLIEKSARNDSQAGDT